MLISGMLTRQTKSDGFTLLELMLCMAIIGLVSALGVVFFDPGADRLAMEAREVASILSQARSDAILSRKAVWLNVEGDKIWLNDARGKEKIIKLISPDSQLRVEGKTGARTIFMFSPMGYTAEQLMTLSDQKQIYSIYLPAIGAPLLSVGRHSLSDMRELDHESQ